MSDDEDRGFEAGLKVGYCIMAAVFVLGYLVWRFGWEGSIR